MIPAFSAYHQYRIICELFRLDNRFFENRILLGTTRLVHVIKLRRQLKCHLVVLRAQHIKGILRRLQSPRSIHARSQPKAKMACIHLMRLDSRYRHQRTKPCSACLRQDFEPPVDMDAILIDECHDITDRPKRHEIKQPLLLSLR